MCMHGAAPRIYVFIYADLLNILEISFGTEKKTKKWHRRQSFSMAVV